MVGYPSTPRSRSPSLGPSLLAVTAIPTGPKLNVAAAPRVPASAGISPASTHRATLSGTWRTGFPEPACLRSRSIEQIGCFDDVTTTVAKETPYRRWPDSKACIRKRLPRQALKGRTRAAAVSASCSAEQSASNAAATNATHPRIVITRTTARLVVSVALMHSSFLPVAGSSLVPHRVSEPARIRALEVLGGLDIATGVPLNRHGCV